MHPLFVSAHVVGAFLFVLAHGVSMGAALKMRGQRDRERVTMLLQMSQAAIGIMYIGLLLLLAGGIAAGFGGDYWGKAWIWASIGVLAVVLGAMYGLATPHYMKLRAALAAPDADGKVRESKQPPLTDAQVDAMLDSSRPYVLALVGGIGLTLILWLMVVKPF
jgi:hypothetical protein